MHLYEAGDDEGYKAHNVGSLLQYVTYLELHIMHRKSALPNHMHYENIYCDQVSKSKKGTLFLTIPDL